MLRKLVLVVLVLTALLMVQSPVIVVRAQAQTPGLDFNAVFGFGATGLFLVALVVLAFAAGHAHGWQAGLSKADQVIQQAANNPAFIEAVKGATAGVSPDVVNRILTTTETVIGALVQFLPATSPVKQLVADSEKLAEEIAAPPPANPVQPPVSGGAA